MSSFSISNTYYNRKPLPGLPQINLDKIRSNTGNTYPWAVGPTGTITYTWTGTNSNGTGVTGSYTGPITNLYPTSQSAPYATSDFMQLSNIIQGYEQGAVNKIQGPTVPSYTGPAGTVGISILYYGSYSLPNFRIN